MVVLSASEAPKEAPVRKYLPSSVYLEEKTDEQKKEEVKKNLKIKFFLIQILCCVVLSFGTVKTCLDL